MNTVRTLMNGLFKRIIRNSHDKIEVIEPREYKSDRTVCYVIDHLDLWHYFVAIDYIDNAGVF